MALVNEILAARYNQALAKLFGIKTDRSPAPQLAPEIQPAFIIELERPEFSFLKGERLWAAQVTVAAGASTAFGLISNPLNSGKLSVVTYANAIPIAATHIRIGSATAVAPTAGIISPIDSRDPGYLTSGKMTTLIDGGAASSPITDIHEERSGAIDQTVEFQHVGPVGASALAILSPGFAFVCQLVTVAIGASFSFRGYERDFEPGELNP